MLRKILSRYFDLVEVNFGSESLCKMNGSSMSEPGKVSVMLLIDWRMEVYLMELFQVIHGHYKIKLWFVPTVLNTHKMVNDTYLSDFTVAVNVVSDKSVLDELVGLWKEACHKSLVYQTQHDSSN